MGLLDFLLVLNALVFEFGAVFLGELGVDPLGPVDRVVDLLDADLQPLLPRVRLLHQILLVRVRQSNRHVVPRDAQGQYRLGRRRPERERRALPQNQAVFAHPHARRLQREVELVVGAVLAALERAVEALVVYLLLQHFVRLFGDGDLAVVADPHLARVQLAVDSHFALADQKRMLRLAAFGKDGRARHEPFRFETGEQESFLGLTEVLEVGDGLIDDLHGLGGKGPGF